MGTSSSDGGAASIRARTMPDWGPLDLAAALPAGPVAVLDGLILDGRRCTLVAWEPAAQAKTLDDSLALAESAGVPAGAPALLGAVVGAIGWEGDAAFWLPGSAVLFDPSARLIWCRGRLPEMGGGKGDRTARLQSAPDLDGADAGVGRGRARPLWSRGEYSAAVAEAQRRMAAGELQKVILSVPFLLKTGMVPLTVYSRLPSRAPMGLRYLLDTGSGGWALTGVSPEPLVLLKGRRAELHLLAGTRPARPGAEEELVTSAKDRAEHAVAVAQGVDDLAGVCVPRSVAVGAYRTLERHPGLVHLASHMNGTLRSDATPADLVRACFRTGTVAGVPREAAIRLIAELEPVPRGWYAGAVGALLPGGDLQLWLTLRSIFLQNGTARVQTGAGIVQTSDPAAEWRECLAKARATLAALEAEVDPGDR